jgi:hypothetical protein
MAQINSTCSMPARMLAVVYRAAMRLRRFSLVNLLITAIAGDQICIVRGSFW